MVKIDTNKYNIYIVGKSTVNTFDVKVDNYHNVNIGIYERYSNRSISEINEVVEPIITATLKVGAKSYDVTNSIFKNIGVRPLFVKSLDSTVKPNTKIKLELKVGNLLIGKASELVVLTLK